MTPTIAVSFLDTTARVAGAAANFASSRTAVKYRNPAAQYVMFCPFVVETPDPLRDQGCRGGY